MSLHQLARLSLSIVALCGGACSTSGGRRASTPLPYAVRLTVQPVQPHSEDTSPAVPLALKAETLEADLSHRMWLEGTFTDVLSAEEWTERFPAGFSPDLDMEVSIRGSDFGSGRIEVAGALASTVAWLFAGYGAWYIADRRYPNSDVVLFFKLRDPRSGRTLYSDFLPLAGLRLSLLERSGPGDWFYGIFLPPCASSGDPGAAGRALGERITDFFADMSVGRLVERLPSDQLDHLGCYLVHDEGRREILVLTTSRLNQLKIHCEAGDGRSLSELRGQVGELSVEATATRLEELQARGIFFGREPENLFAWPVRLVPQERGYLWIEAVFDEGNRRGSWTVYQEDDSPGSEGE